MKHSPLSVTLWIQPCPPEENLSSLDLLQELLFAILSSEPWYLLCSNPTARTSPALVRVGTPHSKDHIWHLPTHLALPFGLKPCRLPCTYQSYGQRQRRTREGGLLTTQAERESFNASPLHWGLLGWVMFMPGSQHFQELFPWFMRRGRPVQPCVGAMDTCHQAKEVTRLSQWMSCICKGNEGRATERNVVP